VKKNVGGFVAASLSALNDVKTIQSTGKKKPIPTSQATTPHGLNFLVFFLRTGVASFAAVVLSTVVVIRLPLPCQRSDLKIKRSAKLADDHREDDDHYAHSRRLAHVEAQERALIDVEGQVRAGDAGVRPASS